MSAITEQRREELLSNVASGMKNPDPILAAFALAEYADEETDAKTFKTVFDKVWGAYYPKSDDAFQILSVGTESRRAHTHAMVYVDAFVAALPDAQKKIKYTTQISKVADNIGQLTQAGIKGLSKELAGYIEKNIDTIVGGLKSETATTVIWGFVCHNTFRKPEPTAYSEYLIGKIVDIAEQNKGSDRLWSLGYVGLQWTKKDGPVQNKARYLLLEDLAAADSAEKIAKILSYSVPSGTQKQPDRELDDAAVEKWQSLVGGLGYADKFSAAHQVIRDKYNSPFTQGKTFGAACKSVIEAAEGYQQNGGQPEKVKTVLECMKEMGWGDQKKVGALLAQTSSSPAAPRVKLDDFLKG